MPKRLPGGKVKKGPKPARARAPQPRPAAVAAEVPDAQPRALAPASQPARRQVAPARQSLLSSVRRPAQKAGPSLVTDYSYVVSDLKRIAIVSAGALALLVGLSFVIR